MEGYGIIIMKIKINLFSNLNNQRGGMLVEMLLTLALAAIMLPFIFSFQESRIEREKNIATEKQMELVQSALEKYMDNNKTSLMKTVGKNITRVNLSDLENYGLSEKIIDKNPDTFQLRILKTNDNNGTASLQGIVIRNTSDLTPLRTRKIANIGGNKMGFIQQDKAVGAFGTWRTNISNLGVNAKRGLIKTTNKTHGNNVYLWRLPSDNQEDATMKSAFNLGKHNIITVNSLNANTAIFDEILYARQAITDKIIFNTRTTIDGNFKTSQALVAGDMSSDFRNIEIKNTLNLANTAKFSNFNAADLWVMDLNLSGLSLMDSDDVNLLKINQVTDMVSGSISAMNTTVNYTGSITPRLVVSNLITDSSNENYYWNLEDNTANFYDVTFMELNRMASALIKANPDNKTISGQLFTNIATNKNATASDFINTNDEIAAKVRAKYSQLNLE